MSASSGESHLTTLFADVHYYFSDPSSKPQHHRFDKASYLYLFHEAAQQQVKIQIANHAGTPDQDSFSGYLNHARIQYSYKQPALFTISVDTSSLTDTSQWHLPSYNERNETKYMYKIHTVDVYLWTEKDAVTLIGYLKNILAPGRLDIRNAPNSQHAHPEHTDSMSPVVQQLEKTAIGSNFPPRTGSTVSTQSFPGPPTSAFPGPPTQAAPAAAPMAYNPAAPAAPEPIAHREKTPPPPDDGTGTGLKAAAKYDNVQQATYSAGPSAYAGQGPQQGSYFSGPPQAQHQQRQGSTSSIPSQAAGPQRTYSSGFAAPPQQQAQPAPSFGPFAQSTISAVSPPPPQQQQQQQAFQRKQSFGLPPTGQYSGSPASSSPAPPAYATQPALQSPPAFAPPPSQFAPPPQQQATASSAQAPIGGFSSYAYGAAGGAPDAANQYGGYTGDVHAQLYRPTEDEAAHAHDHAAPPRRRKTGSGAPGEEKPKLEDSFGRLEGKVGKYLNKLDKLW